MTLILAIRPIVRNGSKNKNRNQSKKLNKNRVTIQQIERIGDNEDDHHQISNVATGQQIFVWAKHIGKNLKLFFGKDSRPNGPQWNGETCGATITLLEGFEGINVG
jgi:hypothetical protein